MRVAALQIDIAWEDPEANFTKLGPWLDAAEAAGARLVVLPELFSTGFSMATGRIAEPPDGPSAGFLLEQATRRGLWLGGSVAERPPGAQKPFNTFLLASPGGEAHRYRKIYPFTFAREHEAYAAGDEPLTVDVEGVRVSPLVCYDLRFSPEFWGLAERTDAFLVVANWPAKRRHHWRTLLAARAIDNQAYVVGVNRVGHATGLDYAGDSRVIDPWGEVLCEAAAQETMLLAELDPGRVARTRTRFPIMADRRQPA